MLVAVLVGHRECRFGRVRTLITRGLAVVLELGIDSMWHILNGEGSRPVLVILVTDYIRGGVLLRAGDGPGVGGVEGVPVGWIDGEGDGPVVGGVEGVSVGWADGEGDG